MCAVYPRERGGTAGRRIVSAREVGLSPRTRGNRGSADRVRQRGGSIPANAGEPRRGDRGRGELRVYPRERGGTDGWQCWWITVLGLSPRTRGNRYHDIYATAGFGSIPANAGEPFCELDHSLSLRVYPRERGGTAVGLPTGPSLSGLSPRTRGNPSTPSSERVSRGSIPANAGEPIRSHSTAAPSRVYPRERGGTLPFRC